MQKFLITGSSSGVGKYLTENLLEQNNVVGIARRNNFKHVNYHHIALDLAKVSLVTDKAKQIAKEHEDINHIIINAGFGYFKELDQFSEKQIIELFNVNIISQIILLRFLLSNLRKQKNSKIIFIGSEAALNGAKKATIYAATKFAMRGFAQSLRAELKQDNIAVTMLNPGVMDSDFYKNLDFTFATEKANKINLKDIFMLIDLICKLDNHMVIDEINLTPMKNHIKYKEKS